MTNQLDRAALITALDAESQQVLALLPQFSDQQWRTNSRADGWTAHDIAGHMADSTYGLALMLLGESTVNVPADPLTGQADASVINQTRREKNRDLPREKVLSRMTAAFATARRAFDTVEDYATVVPFGQGVNKGWLMQRIIDHSVAHREELQALLAQ